MDTISIKQHKMLGHPNPRYRRDIDGLRAIAVLSVIGFHFFPSQLKGGFVGVDIFFVISGYLISTIIFTSLERDNFSFIDFYGRRIRRIFPALITVLTATFAFGWFALYPDEYQQLGKHLAAGAGFVSNFLLLKESGYFDLAAETKPFLHLWSLGVEEQFYILYPPLLWLAWKRKLNLLSITILIALVSFTLNLSKFKSHPATAFYSPQTRFWELMLGAMLAYVTVHNQLNIAKFKSVFNHYLRKIIYSPSVTMTPERLGNNVPSILGLILILTSIFLITKEKAFPGWLAALPTIGALLLILGGSEAWINRTILSHRLLVWLGIISFPLYLWHWVLLSFARIMEGETPTVQIKIVIIAISILLAWLTYKLVENPLRHGNFKKSKSICLTMLMLFLGCIGYQTFNGQKITLKQSAQFSPQQINNLTQFSWEENRNHQSSCIDKFGKEFTQYCLIDDISKQPEMLLIGDSNANHLFYGLNKASKGKNLLMLGQGGCLPFVGVSTRLTEEGELHCETVMNKALNIAASEKSIKTVVLSMMGAGYINQKRSLGGGTMDLHFINTNNEFQKSIVFKEGMRQTLKLLVHSNKNIVFIISTPRLNFEPKSCFRPIKISKHTQTAPCMISRELYENDNREYRRAAFSVLSEFPQVKIFDSAAELCDKRYCYAIKNQKILYRDKTHLSLHGSEYLGKKIAEIL